MQKMNILPHRVCDSTCYWNGLEDIFAWSGTDYTDFLLPSVGGMPGFAYVNFRKADPPHQVYWGACPKFLLRDLAQIIGFSEIVIEGRAFRSMFAKLKEFLDAGQPVMAGALDMYYLHYYNHLYKRIHVPIHYVLVVGYDDEERAVYVNDCGYKSVQRISYDDLEASLNVSTPGMSKRNTFRAFVIPKNVPSEFEVATKGFHFKAQKFLRPPVKLFGVPAMRKAAKEILEWDNKKCFEHMVTYATVPPMLPKTYENSNGMRFRQANVLATLESKYGVDRWKEASVMFRRSGEEIIRLCEAAMKLNNKEASDRLRKVAQIEQNAYRLLL